MGLAPRRKFNIMKVLQTIAGLAAHSGGTSTCTYDLLSAIHKVDVDANVDLLTPSVTDPTDKLMGIGEDWIKVVENDYKTPFAISHNMSRFLRESDYDIYHTNGMWLQINHTTCAEARRRGKPYLITSHGMLYPEAMKRSAWKKWPMRKLWFDRDIREAFCIHVTCEAEMRHIRNFGYRGPIAVIGNPVTVPEYTKQLFENRGRKDNSNLRIAFLGRLHPIKKIENILYGIAKCHHNDIEVYIIGKGDDAYESFLKAEAKRLGISNRVYFMGFLNGRDKFEQLARMDALFVPSEMENFGMIIPEALIVGTPVMASLGTPWESLNTNSCGWWRDNSPESIAKVIEDLSALSPDEHRKMGIRGREFILQNFAATQIASKMLKLYSWILGENERPEFVFV